MSEKNNGGPAFPVPYHPEQQWENPQGMTLRDYFAAKAICGTLPGKAFNDAELDEYARLSYRMADAMLRARGEV